MPRVQTVHLEPRKQPVQARSIANVEAILEATIHVLLEVGKEQLTTTRVAARAGVSVGSLYQYFPNKSALLQAALRSHLEEISLAVEQACREEKGSSLSRMATRLANTFLEAKMRDPKVSVALYAVSSDVDGWRIASAVSASVNDAIVEMLQTAREPLSKDPQLAATMLQAAMMGVSRKLLEGPHPEKRYESLRQELILMLRAYLALCTEEED